MATVRDTVRAIGVAVTRSPLLDVLEEADPAAWRAALPGSKLGVGDVVRAVFAGAFDVDVASPYDAHRVIREHRFNVDWYLSEKSGKPPTVVDAMMEFAYHARWMVRDLATHDESSLSLSSDSVFAHHVRDAQKYLVRALELAGVPRPRDVWEATLADALRGTT